MSRKHRSRKDDGFYELVPRDHDEDDSQDEYIRYLESRVQDLEDEKDDLWDRYLESIDRSIADTDAFLEQTRAEQMQALANLAENSLELAGMRRDSIDVYDDPRERPFSYGVGLSFGGGKDPELYRISQKGQPKGKAKFKGGELEVQPHRGFNLKLRWGRD